MSEKLKPCPFCDSDNIAVSYDDYLYARFYCQNCDTVVSIIDNKNDAIEAWNKRAERTCTEKDCSIEYGTLLLSCGHSVESYPAPKYCSVCGAKVVQK